MITLNKWIFIKYFLICKKIIKDLKNLIFNFLNINFFFKNFSFILINFFKEGMLIDSLQKLSADRLLKTLFIESSQFFSLNFYNNLFIKFFINEFYYKLSNLCFKNVNLNLSNLFNNTIFLLFFLLNFMVVFMVIFNYFIY